MMSLTTVSRELCSLLSVVGRWLKGCLKKVYLLLAKCNLDLYEKGTVMLFMSC